MSNAGRMVVPPQFILNAKADTGVGTTIPCKGFQHILLEVSSEASSTFTIQLQGAMGGGKLGTTPPTFSSAKSTSNAWDYIETIDYNNGNPIDGNTGTAFSAVIDVNYLEYNINGLDFINAEVISISGGAVTLRVRLFTNS